MHSSADSTAFVAELRDVSKVFGDIRAVDGISLRVERGETLAVLGPNGAGKTTAISLMLGLRAPTSGHAWLMEQDPREHSSRTHVGTMLQQSGLPHTLKVREVMELFRRLYPSPMSVSQAIHIAGLEEKASSLVGKLSGGQQQRLYFAVAMIGNPDLLFLDEPTVGLDVESRRNLWDQIDKLMSEGKTLVLTTHYLEEADALADRILVIDHGKVIAEGSPSAIKARVGGKTVRFHTGGVQETYLRNLPGVQRVSVVEDKVELYTLEPEDALRKLFSDDIGMRDLEVVGADLEEAFISLTSKRREVAV